MLSMRDPYPFPQLEGDDNFIGSRSTQVNKSAG